MMSVDTETRLIKGSHASDREVGQGVVDADRETSHGTGNTVDCNKK